MARGNFLGMGGSMEPAAVAKSGRKRAKGVLGALSKVLSATQKKDALDAAALGMTMDKVAILCGFPAGNETQWHRWLDAHPDFATELKNAQVLGELQLQRSVREAGQGWQGSAWLLERTRGYVARASMEHTGKGGSTLTIAHQLLSSVAERER